MLGLVTVFAIVAATLSVAGAQAVPDRTASRIAPLAADAGNPLGEVDAGTDPARRLTARGPLGPLRKALADAGARIEEEAAFLTELGFDAAEAQEFGERLSSAARKADLAIQRLRNARKRFGMIEEVVLAEVLAARLEEARANFAKLAGDPKLAAASRAAIQAILNGESLKQAAVREVEKAAAPKLRAHKELRDLLKDPQFKRFERLVLAELEARVLEAFEELGAEAAANAIPTGALGVIDLAALERLIASGDLAGLIKTELRKRIRSFAAEQLARLVIKVQSGGIVVQLAAELIVRWLGPKLREATRFKGKVDRRTRRTLKGFANRSRELRALRCADLERVRVVVARAEVALAATRFLERDLRGRPLLEKLRAGEAQLAKLVKSTKKRCGIGSAAAQKVLEEHLDAVQNAREAIDELKDALAATAVAEPADCPTGTLDVTVSPGGPTQMTPKGTDAPNANQIRCLYENATGSAKATIEINWTPPGSATTNPAGACELGGSEVSKEGIFWKSKKRKLEAAWVNSSISLVVPSEQELLKPLVERLEAKAVGAAC